MRARFFAWSLALAGLTCSAPARAEPLEGFVLSAAVGPGLFRATSGTDPDKRTFRGETLSFHALVGGRIGRYVALGAAYLRDGVFGLRASDSVVDGDEPDLEHIRMFLSSYGLFLDVRVLDVPELHLQVFPCYGHLYVDGRASNEVENPSGFVLAVAATAEFRVARRLTVGGGLRFTWAPMNVTETGRGGTDVTVLLPALLAVGRFD